jgi:hypothetical protein
MLSRNWGQATKTTAAKLILFAFSPHNKCNFLFTTDIQENANILPASLSQTNSILLYELHKTTS